MNELAGKVAIITGASRGIGAAAAAALAEAGAAVMLAARDGARASGVADAINAKGGRAVAMACDIVDYAGVERLAGETQQRFGAIDILVNNAGVAEPLGALAQGNPNQWGENVRINVIGAYHVARAVLAHMLAAHQGRIIHISSGGTHRAIEGISAYCVSKAGLAMLSRAITAEYADAGIKVFDLNPGIIDTDMVGLVRASGAATALGHIPRSALAPVDHPAAAIRYLCTVAADDLAGTEASLRDPEFRRRVGLP
jgi:3-oxoacyl-[acyl-carrier protein] reductase